MCKDMEIRKSVKKADGDECVCLVVDKVSGGEVLAGRASQGDIVS